MDWMLPFTPAPLAKRLNYLQPMLFTGSCFADEIASLMQQHHFNVVAQPFGTVFNPVSIAQQLQRIIHKQLVQVDELHLHQELWHSWQHHTSFSHHNKEEALAMMNAHIEEAHQQIQHPDTVVWITLGSAYAYTHQNNLVANCHKYPQTQFTKQLLSTDEITSSLAEVITALHPRQVMLTVSPVRHTRDGLVENNRSKARLLEAVHQLTETHENVFYFPAYELVMDVLRDYRFYVTDLVHPNAQAVQLVWQEVVNACFDERTQAFVKDMNHLYHMQQHRVQHPDTEAYRKFKEALKTKEMELSKRYFG
jgi:hypothetical protein